MSKSKRNPNLCTTHKSLTKGKGSIYRVSGLFAGKARVCWIKHMEKDIYQATTAAYWVDEEVSERFRLKDLLTGKINIMCLERGE